jgi:hypothetical protein
MLNSIVPVIRQSTHAGILTAGTLLLLCHGAKAQEATTTPFGQNQSPGGASLQAVLSENGSFDTNPLLVTHGAKELYGSVTTPELIFSDKTPTSLITADTSLVENIFNQSNFDSTDLHSKASFSEQTARWGAGIQEQTDYDTTRTSELTNFGLNGVNIGKSVQHLGFTATPEVSYNPTQIDKFTMQGSYNQSTYDNNIFSDYQIFSASPTYAHDFDQLNTGTFSVQAQRYQTTSGPQSTIDTVGPVIGWNSKFTPRLSGSVTVGVQEARQFGSGVQQEPWTLQYDYSASIAFTGQQDTASFSTSQADYPFGYGTEALLTAFNVSEAHELNENFAFNVGSSYQYAHYQSSLNGALDSLLSGTGGLTYHATDRVDIVTSYQYRYETLTGSSGHADDHTVTLGLVYRPKAWAL